MDFFTLDIYGGLALYETPTDTTFELLSMYVQDDLTKSEADFKILDAYRSYLQTSRYEVDPEVLENHINRLYRYITELHAQNIYGVFLYY